MGSDQIQITLILMADGSLLCLGCPLGGLRMDVSFVDRTARDRSIVGVAAVGLCDSPLFGLAFLFPLSSLGRSDFNVGMPWAHSFLHMYLIIAYGISFLFLPPGLTFSHIVLFILLTIVIHPYNISTRTN